MKIKRHESLASRRVEYAQIQPSLLLSEYKKNSLAGGGAGRRLATFATLIRFAVLDLVGVLFGAKLVELGLVLLLLNGAALDPLVDAVLFSTTVHRCLDAVLGQRRQQLVLLLRAAVVAVHGHAQLRRLFLFGRRVVFRHLSDKLRNKLKLLR